MEALSQIGEEIRLEAPDVQGSVAVRVKGSESLSVLGVAGAIRRAEDLGAFGD